MPPRFAYWTIILEGKPTAFRAHDREDLLPTFRQLQARHPDVVLKWFARGQLWDSQEDARAGERQPRERRKSDWRPGGEHRDPRARFDVPRDEKRRRFAAKLRRDARERGGAEGQSPGEKRPWQPRPEWRPREEQQRPPRRDREGGPAKPPTRPGAPGQKWDQRPDRGPRDRPPRPEWGDRQRWEPRDRRPPRPGGAASGESRDRSGTPPESRRPAGGQRPPGKGRPPGSKFGSRPPQARPPGGFAGGGAPGGKPKTPGGRPGGFRPRPGDRGRGPKPGGGKGRGGGGRGGGSRG